MLEEAVQSDLLPLIANLACEEVHIGRVMLDKRRQLRHAQKQKHKQKQKQFRQELDNLSVMLHQKRLVRQRYQKEYWGVPLDYNEKIKEKDKRSYLGEWGCLFKHEVTVWYHELEILEKHCRMLVNAEDEREQKRARQLRDSHLAGWRISDELVDKITGQIQENLGLNEKQIQEQEEEEAGAERKEKQEHERDVLILHNTWADEIADGCSHLKEPEEASIPSMRPLCDITDDICSFSTCPLVKGALQTQAQVKR